MSTAPLSFLFFIFVGLLLGPLTSWSAGFKEAASRMNAQRNCVEDTSSTCFTRITCPLKGGGSFVGYLKPGTDTPYGYVATARHFVPLSSVLGSHYDSDLNDALSRKRHARESRGPAGALTERHRQVVDGSNFKSVRMRVGRMAKTKVVLEVPACMNPGDM
jgi:hypothetical protein